MEGFIPLRKDHGTLPEVYNHSLSLPQRDLWPVEIDTE